MKKILLIFFICLFMTTFISATCEVEISDYEGRLGNLESKIDLIESHYNLMPTIAQDIKQLQLSIEEISQNDSNFKIYLIPGTIIIVLIILLAIIIARRKYD